jgi:hypothetical protein
VAEAQITPERWERLKSLLVSALEMGPAERAAWLDQLPDPSLRSDVERLLAAGEAAATDFLRDPTTAHNLLYDSRSGSERLIGRRVGPYRIVEEISTGGMGEVYRAFRDDDQYRKLVAIKTVRTGHESRIVV